MKNLKGYVIKKEVKKVSPISDMATGTVLSMGKVYKEVKDLQNTVIDTINSKIEEVDSALNNVEAGANETLEKINTTLEEKTLAIDEVIKTVQIVTSDSVNSIEQFKEEALKIIEEKQPQNGEPGANGQNADEEKIIEAVLAKIKPVDEKKLLGNLLKAVPKNKPSVKIITQNVESDPMGVINKILELVDKGELKLKSSNISGLDQTISAFRNQIAVGRGYLHGGGGGSGAGLTHPQVMTRVSLGF